MRTNDAGSEIQRAVASTAAKKFHTCIAASWSSALRCLSSVEKSSVGSVAPDIVSARRRQHKLRLSAPDTRVAERALAESRLDDVRPSLSDSVLRNAK